jgi:hypothetical protein
MNFLKVQIPYKFYFILKNDVDLKSYHFYKKNQFNAIQNKKLLIHHVHYTPFIPGKTLLKF